MIRKLAHLNWLLVMWLLSTASEGQLPKVQSAPSGKNPSSSVMSGAQKPFSIDLSKQPTLYVVGYAHLDTQWRWEYPQTIQEYLSKTMRNNFALFEKYPHYIFNFTGANRYRLMKEYYPADFEKLKHYVAAGRWYPSGSSMEEGDVNSPNAESIIRQVLYGNDFYRREFGKASSEYMLPDCFGFPASLPSILSHAGIKGFSTQKLSASWQPAPHVGGPDSPERTPDGIPFNVGVWEGTDGTSVIAALNPLSYTSEVTYDLSKPPEPPPPPDPSLTPEENRTRARASEDWVKRVQINGALTGINADYHYVGTGDIGGAPDESSIRLMEAITSKGEAAPTRPQHGNDPHTPATIKMGDGPIHVIWSKADQMFQDILHCCKTDRLPRYKGDLELINHSAGSLTSEAYQKRWMRKNELLADAAERASVAASWLGGQPYPLERLNNAWTLVMGGQFHDILPGTATPKAFEFAWNDDVIAMNQFAGVLTSASQAVVAGMDTQTKGRAVVVYNPLNIRRQDVVEANLSFAAGTPKAVRVVGPDGREVPAQLALQDDGTAKVLFLAETPSVGYSVYDIQPAEAGATASELRVSDSSLENARYRVRVDQHGDVSSIFDKKISHELLSAPVQLVISTDKPRYWPAWNMDYEDVQRPPRSRVGGAVKARVIENGPVRVAIEVTREAEGSRFLQIIRLTAGDAGNRVEFLNTVDWNTREGNLKATFPLSAANPLATYNWDIGTIQRPTENERQFEVASHQWIDLTDKSGDYGATILTDCKNGSDKPDDHVLRLTLIRTPGTRGEYDDQGTQDLGHHEITFGLAGHGGDWRLGHTDWQAYRLNQPLIAFESPHHAGRLGKSFSLLNISDHRVRVLALKKAESSDEVILRLVEVDGKPAHDVHIAFAAPLLTAREVNGQEQPVGTATLSRGGLVTSLGPYQPRSFAVRLANTSKMSPPRSVSLRLAYDVSVATREGRPADGCFDCSLDRPDSMQGEALPAEMLPSMIEYAGIRFNLVNEIGQPNAVSATGQKIDLPTGPFHRLYLLAAAIGDQPATFHIDDVPVKLTIQDWTGFIGQWDDRVWKSEAVVEPPSETGVAQIAPQEIRVDEYAHMVGMRPGFIKRADVAWFASHRHSASGASEPYRYSYLFAYAIDLPRGAKTLTLPKNDKVRVLAVSLAEEPPSLVPVQPLYDTLQSHASFSPDAFTRSAPKP